MSNVVYLKHQVAKRMEGLDRAIGWLREEVAEPDDREELAARLAELKSDLDELLEEIDNVKDWPEGTQVRARAQPFEPKGKA